MTWVSRFEDRRYLPPIEETNALFRASGGHIGSLDHFAYRDQKAPSSDGEPTCRWLAARPQAIDSAGAKASESMPFTIHRSHGLPYTQHILYLQAELARSGLLSRLQRGVSVFVMLRSVGAYMCTRMSGCAARLHEKLRGIRTTRQVDLCVVRRRCGSMLIGKEGACEGLPGGTGCKTEPSGRGRQSRSHHGCRRTITRNPFQTHSVVVAALRSGRRIFPPYGRRKKSIASRPRAGGCGPPGTGAKLTDARRLRLDRNRTRPMTGSWSNGAPARYRVRRMVSYIGTSATLLATIHSV